MRVFNKRAIGTAAGVAGTFLVAYGCSLRKSLRYESHKKKRVLRATRNAVKSMFIRELCQIGEELLEEDDYEEAAEYFAKAIRIPTKEAMVLEDLHAQIPAKVYGIVLKKLKEGKKHAEGMV